MSDLSYGTCMKCGCEHPMGPCAPATEQATDRTGWLAPVLAEATETEKQLPEWAKVRHPAPTEASGAAEGGEVFATDIGSWRRMDGQWQVYEYPGGWRDALAGNLAKAIYRRLEDSLAATANLESELAAARREVVIWKVAQEVQTRYTETAEQERDVARADLATTRRKLAALVAAAIHLDSDHGTVACNICGLAVAGTKVEHKTRCPVPGAADAAREGGGDGE